MRNGAKKTRIGRIGSSMWMEKVTKDSVAQYRENITRSIFTICASVKTKCDIILTQSPIF